MIYVKYIVNVMRERGKAVSDVRKYDFEVRHQTFK